jgi:hypothetical protein
MRRFHLRGCDTDLNRLLEREVEIHRLQSKIARDNFSADSSLFNRIVSPRLRKKERDSVRPNWSDSRLLVRFTNRIDFVM